MAEPAAEPPNAPDLKLRLVEPGDEGAILKLHEVVYGAPLDPALLQWKIHYNIERLQAKGFDGYGAGVVVLQDGRIVGFNSYQTRRMRYFGHQILAAESGTTMASPETRGLHLFSRMAHFAGDALGARGVEFIYGVGNQFSVAPALKSGFIEVGQLRLFSRRPGPVRRAVARMTGRKQTDPRSARQPGLADINPEQLDSVFAQTGNPASSGDFEIELLRDAAGWRRRYGEHPTLKYHLVPGAPTTFVLRLNPKSSVLSASICDCAPIPPHGAGAGGHGLEALTTSLKQGKIETVDCWAVDGSAMAGMLESAGFTPSPVARFSILMFPASGDSQAPPESSTKFFMAGDFDIV